MKRFLLAIFLVALSSPAQTRIDTDEQLLTLFRQNTVPGVYELAARTFSKPGTATFGSDENLLTGTSEQPIVIRGQGIGETIIECPLVCFFSGNSHVVFEDLTIRGAVNSQHLKNWVFRRVHFLDVLTPNGPRQTFGGQGGAIVYKTAGGGAGAGPIRFESCIFEPAKMNRADTVLDFVGVQGVEILDSVFESCNRGCLQAKGGSGTVVPYRIEGNLIKDAGDRGIFLGGSTDRGRFDPPIAEAKHEFGSATVRNNVILGGLACFAGSTFSGPILFENNLCHGQSLFMWRILTENEQPEIEQSRGLTLRRNVFSAFTGENEFAFNFTNRPGVFAFDSMLVEENAFGHDPEIERYWPTVMLRANRLGADLGIVFEDGIPRVASADLASAGIGPTIWVGPARITPGGVVSAASFASGAIAPEQIISVFGGGFGSNLTVAPESPLPSQLGGVSVRLLDVLGFRTPLALLAVAPGQINAIVPAGVALGDGILQVHAPGDPVAEIPVTVRSVAPGVFSANASGSGIAAAAAVRIGADGEQTPTQVLQGSGPISGFPIDLGPEGEQVVLLLFGTGFRNSSTVRVTIGGVEAEVVGVAAQGEFAGLDQINAIIPRSLAGRGEVEVRVVIDGVEANVVTIVIG